MLGRCIIRLLALLLAGSVGAVATPRTIAQPAPRPTHGPFMGHLRPTAASFWARMPAAGKYALIVSNPASGKAFPAVTRRARAEDDYCLVWRVSGLQADTEYEYCLYQRGRRLAGGREFRFRTPPLPERPGKVRLAFGSCAHPERFPSQPIWPRMVREGAVAIVLLGDTPYIDSTELAVQRRRYGEFYRVPELRRVLRRTPFYATWDDHDFGRNDTDGQLPGKEDSRRAFIEYHANPSYGDGRQGVYTKFRLGAVEVFLLDTRWFAGTEPSPVAPDKPTLLGKAQWQWLRRGLRRSTAKFKILACGMVWNGAVRPGKQDHWMTYPYEREALFRFIGDQDISGVVLIGGDVHRSRALRYQTASLAGYDLTELITSPMANTVIEAANAPHPGLLHDVGEEQTFLLLTADSAVSPATLSGRCIAADGRTLFEVILDERQLRRPNPTQENGA